jgi:hypothetical protein
MSGWGSMVWPMRFVLFNKYYELEVQVERIEEMRTVITVVAAGAVVVLAFATSYAQNPQSAPPAPEPTVIVQERIVGSAGAPPLPGAGTFVFVASEFGFGGKIVQGKPYSAEAVTESIQTLGDGNRIVNRSSSSVYRDSEGRTRREQTLNAIGGFANASEPIQTIFINDPVAGVSYTLDSRTHVAHKTMPLKIEQKFGPIGSAPVGAPLPKFEFKLETKPGAPAVPIGPPGAGAPMAVGEHFSIRTESGGVGYAMTRRKTGDDKNAVHESLGRQTIEGVEADGTRVTITIPAGEIGNERPIEIVSEQWYSPELGVLVMSRHSDPRSGETTYRLTNINRVEPEKSLFEVPAGYTVSEGLPGIMKQAPLAPKVRKLANPE